MAAEDWFPDFVYYPLYDEDGFEETEPSDFMGIDDDGLFKETSKAKNEKIKGIRNYYKTHKRLSEKQRYCLCAWISERENESLKYV